MPTQIYGILIRLVRRKPDAMPIHTHDAITASRSIITATFFGSSYPKKLVHIKLDTQFTSGSIPSGIVASTQRILSALANENTIAPSIRVITRHSIARMLSFQKYYLAIELKSSIAFALSAHMISAT